MRLAILGVIGLSLILLAVAVSEPGSSGSIDDADLGQALGDTSFADRIGLDQVLSGDDEYRPLGTVSAPLDPKESTLPVDITSTPPNGTNAGIWKQPAQFAPPDPVN